MAEAEEVLVARGTTLGALVLLALEDRVSRTTLLASLSTTRLEAAEADLLLELAELAGLLV